MIKKITIIIVISLLLLILAWMYKFNYLSSLEWYDVDGNKTQNKTSDVFLDQTIIDQIAIKYPDLEWIGCILNDNNIDIACVLIDQINFEWLSRVIIFELNKDWISAKHKEFSQKKWESVNFVCGWNCYPSGFWFEGDNTFIYKWHDIISPDKTYSIAY